mmetsp:Transcript_5975/g.14151  ORF Transcript_5975/g.14151 Transcript_5975/m.14151 type:complete len:503 (+) Transcript_5975:118-1626(+)|eukprot:CAMPEP_0113627658 /NCGR_PEP_ID=MMETSP0017_2-20120614/14326_1 /TAXON_ID=2856 /ORGANISM="Cylindrotheca closterium" /LENGTH=502 /DNA_ID=CAMNT_0000537925 /DNA_START=114 /DNA_END=1622 /DNA_ORIENTATION=- /assembly_acc=CAM_ASM_000147
MMMKSSALLLLPLTVSGEDFYYNNNNNGNGSVNSVNNFGGTATSTTSFTPPSGNTYSNSNGNTYSNPQGSYNTNYNSNSNSNGMMNFDEPEPLGAGGGGNPFGGMDQGDDFMGAMGMYGGDMMAMMFGQCLNNIDIDKMMDDPFADVKNRCSDQQAATFNSALDTFKTCAGFDLKELIEDFGSMYIGLLMNCGSYAVDVTQELDDIGTGMEDMEKLKAKESPLPRVPKECVDALVGDNPFGTAFLYAEEFPEREQKCFSELSGKLPMCALSEWPVPIVGSWLSALSCIYGNAKDVIMPLMQDTITSELKMLNDCIPQDINESNCKDIRNKCVFDYDLPAMTMALPPPFWTPPMAQNCKDIASNQFGDLNDRYEAYRQTCIPADDLAIWDIAAGHKEKNKGVKGGASYYMEESTSEDEKKKDEGMADVEEEAAQLGAAAAAPPAAAAPSSSSTKFMPGLLTGLILAFAGMFGYNKYRNGGQMPISNMGYQFNSLELSEGPVFS